MPKPEAAAEWVERSKLAPWSDNPRRNDIAAGKVAESIKRFGFGSPILARRNGEIIAGHTRLKAAEMLGLDRVPVRYLDLDPAEAHLLALADNKLGEVAEWDSAALASVLSGYGLEDAELAGWDSAALEKLADEVIDFGPLDSISEADAFGNVPDGDREPFQGMAFTLADEQVERVKEAIALAKSRGLGTSPVNENSNGNALAAICDAYLADG